MMPAVITQCDKCSHTRSQKGDRRAFIRDVEGQETLSEESHLESGALRMNEFVR